MSPHRIFTLRNAAMIACLTTLGTALWIAGASNTPTQAAVTPPTSMVETIKPLPATTMPNANIPPDVPADEWNQVLTTMHATPGGDKQLPNMAEYLTFQHRVALWQASKQRDETAAQRAQLANYLLQTLPTHLGRSELTAFEARSLEAELLQDSISDPTQLQDALNTEDQRLLAAEPKPDPQTAAAQQAQMADYKKREADITAEWTAMAPADRDQKWLESQLDAARQAAFDGKASL